MSDVMDSPAHAHHFIKNLTDEQAVNLAASIRMLVAEVFQYENDQP